MSIAVVSYAFNRPDRVAAATRQRVLATADALGYTGPDPAGRALRLGTAGSVALVGDGSMDALLGDPAFLLVARGVARACERAGLAVTLGAGVPSSGTVAFRTGAAGPGSLVVVDGPPGVGATRVDAGVEQGAAALGAHLASLGHRRLAVLARPGDDARLRGIRAGWADAGPVHAFQTPGGTAADGEIAARIALGEEPRPTALVALGDRLALGALATARSMGLDVPGDLSLAGIDDLPDAAAAGLTSVFVPYLPMGELAGGILVEALAGRAAPAADPLPTSLAVRGSTAPPRAVSRRRA